MSTYWYLYLTAIIDKVGGLFFGIALGAIIIAVVLMIFLAMESAEYEVREHPKTKKIAKRFFIIAAVFSFLAAFTPSKKDLYIIFGVGTTIEYVKGNEKIQELPNKAIDALGSWFDSITEDNKKEEPKAEK